MYQSPGKFLETCASIIRKQQLSFRAAHILLARNAENPVGYYSESQESYSALFEDKTKYIVIMSAWTGVIYRKMRTKKTFVYKRFGLKITYQLNT